MRPIIPEDLYRFKFLSEVTFSPEGRSACLVVTEMDREKNGYRSRIYVRRNGELLPLTGGGKERSFQYLDEDTLLFPGNREGDTEGPESRWYRISLSGGEASLAYTFPIPVSRVLPLDGGDLVLEGVTMPGFEELYRGEKAYAAAYRKHCKDNADYEEITQVPWWWNGGSYTKGAYTSLYYYDAGRKKLRRLTPLNVSVSGAELSPDKRTVWYMAAPVRALLPLSGDRSLCRLELKSGEVTQLAADGERFIMGGFTLGKSFALVLASDGRHGLNTDVDFYRLDCETGELAPYAKWGESIGCSVCSDVTYGGGRSIKMEDDVCYFISTRRESACLYKLERGEITQLTDRAGAVQCFDVCGGRVLLAAQYDMRLQELYDLKGRRLSRFNDAALRGRYVAQPEPLAVKRKGYEVHGFVCRPMDYDPAKKYPVILDVHGGPKTVYGAVFFHEMQYWAGKGYFVVFCNPTGSDGRGAFMDIRGKYGTVDYEDLMAFCDAALAAYPAMDAGQQFETGGSYGGFMTNWIVGHTDRFRACASQRSISNWFSEYGVADIGVEFTKDQTAGDPWASPEKMWEHSPLKYADRARTPTLFIHSFEDYRCPVDQGYQMFTALVSHGVESKMVCFRGENHELSRSGKPTHRLKRLAEITGWFDSHRPCSGVD